MMIFRFVSSVLSAAAEEQATARTLLLTFAVAAPLFLLAVTADCMLVVIILRLMGVIDG